MLYNIYAAKVALYYEGFIASMEEKQWMKQKSQSACLNIGASTAA